MVLNSQSNSIKELKRMKRKRWRAVEKAYDEQIRSERKNFSKVEELPVLKNVKPRKKEPVMNGRKGTTYTANFRMRFGELERI